MANYVSLLSSTQTSTPTRRHPASGPFPTAAKIADWAPRIIHQVLPELVKITIPSLFPTHTRNPDRSNKSNHNSSQHTISVSDNPVTDNNPTWTDAQANGNSVDEKENEWILSKNKDELIHGKTEVLTIDTSRL